MVGVLVLAVIMMLAASYGCWNSAEKTVSDSGAKWFGEAQVVEAGSVATLSFQVAPGAACRLYILYETTGSCARIGSDAGWSQANENGVVSWTWSVNPDIVVQPGTALLRVSGDSTESWHSFDFSISGSQ